MRSTSWRLQLSATGASCATELTSGAHPVADVAAVLDLETVGADAPIIVVGVDGSDSGRAALRAGAARSALGHGHLLAVHVRPAMPFWLSYSRFHHVGGGIVPGLTAAALASHASLVVVAEGVRHQRPHLCPAHRLARHGLLPVQVVHASGSAK